MFLRQGRHRQTCKTNKQTDRQAGHGNQEACSQLGKKEGRAHTVPARRPLKKADSQACMHICCQAGRKADLAGRQVELEKRQTDLADMQNRHSGQGGY